MTNQAAELIALLERLQALRAQKAISEEEFIAQKAAIFGSRDESQFASTSGVQPVSSQGPPVGHDVLRRNESFLETTNWRAKIIGAGAALMLFAIAVVYLFYSPTDKPADVANYNVANRVNVRSAPTTEGSEIAGRLSPGEVVTGVIARGNERQWIRITEGPHAGRFVWARNLRLIAPATKTPEASQSEQPWLIGRWAFRCNRGEFWREFKKDGEYITKYGGGTWSLDGRVLTIIDATSDNGAREEIVISQGANGALLMANTGGPQVRCSEDEMNATPTEAMTQITNQAVDETDVSPVGPADLATSLRNAVTAGDCAEYERFAAIALCAETLLDRSRNPRLGGDRHIYNNEVMAPVLSAMNATGSKLRRCGKMFHRSDSRKMSTSIYEVGTSWGVAVAPYYWEHQNRVSAEKAISDCAAEYR